MTSSLPGVSTRPDGRNDVSDIREHFDHPELTPEEDRLARGGDPTTTRKHPLQPLHHLPDEADEEDALRHVLAWVDERAPGRRPRQDQLLPYLLIRAMTGDQGVREPPMPYFWQSPDIIVVPGIVDSIDAQAATLTPRLGEPHTIFVRVWNLGRLAAIGARVDAYWANPAFSFGAGSPHPPELIGNAGFDLADRTSTACMSVVRIAEPWIPRWENEGHECLLAVVSCLMDRATVGFDAATDRHVGQLNLHVARPDLDLHPLLLWLGRQIGPNDSMQLVHGLETVTDVLAPHALAGGGDWVGIPRPRPPTHLLVRHDRGESEQEESASRTRGTIGWVTAPERGSRLYRFGQNPESEGEPTKRGRSAVALARLIEADELTGRALAAAMSEDPADTHLLRFEALRDGVVIGGYSIVVTQS